jgi:hypothetical protein
MHSAARRQQQQQKQQQQELPDSRSHPATASIVTFDDFPELRQLLEEADDEVPHNDRRKSSGTLVSSSDGSEASLLEGREMLQEDVDEFEPDDEQDEGIFELDLE